MERFTVVEINQEILHKALDSEIEDFEDAVIEISALTNNIEYILTRNIRDFLKSRVSVKTPEEALALMR